MKFRLALRPEAEMDIVDAAPWYERQQTGLVAEFVQAVSQAIDTLIDNPFVVHAGIGSEISIGFTPTAFLTASSTRSPTMLFSLSASSTPPGTMRTGGSDCNSRTEH